MSCCPYRSARSRARSDAYLAAQPPCACRAHLASLLGGVPPGPPFPPGTVRVLGSHPGGHFTAPANPSLIQDTQDLLDYLNGPVSRALRVAGAVLVGAFFLEEDTLHLRLPATSGGACPSLVLVRVP